MRMKRRGTMFNKWCTLFLVTALAIFLPGCGGSGEGNTPEKTTEVTREDVKQESTEALRTTQAFVVQRKEEYEKRIEAELDEFGSRIEQLKAKAQDAETEAKKEVNNAIEELRRKEKAIRNNLEQLKDQGAETWKEMKASIDGALEDLERSYERALARLQ